MKNDILIIGGGVVGLMTAYFLNKNGKDVTVIDQGELTDMASASFGNAGLISSFEKAPLASPGIISRTLKLMLLGRSPVTFKLNLDPLIIRWLLKFIKSANKDRLKKTLALFDKYGNISVEFYKEISQEIDIDFHHNGLLMVYSDKDAYDNKCKEAIDENKYKILNLEETKTFLPFVNDKVVGSVLLKRNAWLDPGKTVTGLYNYLKSRGVNFITNEKVVKIEYDNQSIISVSSEQNTYAYNTYVFATGADISLLSFIKQKLIMVPAKGYSITFEMDKELKPSIASLFSDIFVAFTPRKDDVRLTSIMEIGTSSRNFDERVMDKVVDRFKKLSIKFEMRNIKKWTGLRPLTPNDMPLIGRDDIYKNLIYATGLGWMGMTFGPAVGNILSDLIVNDKNNIQCDDILLLSGFYQAGC